MLTTAVILLALQFATAEIPPYIKVCQRSDPNVDKCIINSVEELRPKMIKGIPELDVPGIEPLSLGQIALARGPQGAKLTAVVNDVKVRGPSNFIIQELKSDLDRNRFDFKLLLPRLDFAGKYKMDIQVLLLRLQGKGNITGSFTDDFPQCKRNDPELDKCILKAVDVVKPRLLNGIPEVNVPALDPFNVPTLKLDRTASNLRLKATIKNMKAFGGSNFKIEKMKLNLNNKYVGEVKLTIPQLEVTAEYDVRGSRILTLDISGKGKFRSNFTGITVVAKGSAKPIIKDGVEYLQAEKMITKLRIGNGQVFIDDTERPVAASSAAAFFNASPSVVLDILNPLIEESSAAIFKAFFNKIFGTIPLNEILVVDA
ncbi:circadian clock-controlled protein daywake-like [Vanessa cardui]|uniref:circadian clock-controlled protein daywake-like n=1 Tax=Vanessa cardui TaxID=171605 RepID=UPI001F12C0EF|nr:circadian clock-controlled protein daywake-like [Vanessa cardui]